MENRLEKALKELSELFEQQKRFVTSAPADEPLRVTEQELQEYFERSERIRDLNQQLPELVKEQEREQK